MGPIILRCHFFKLERPLRGYDFEIIGTVDSSLLRWKNIMIRFADDIRPCEMECLLELCVGIEIAAL